MITPSIRSLEERNRRHSRHPYIWLLEITLPSGMVIRLARNPKDTDLFEWPMDSGQFWQQANFDFDDINESSKGETRELTFKVANASGKLLGYLEDLEDWRKLNGREPVEARLIAVNAKLIDQEEPEAEYRFQDRKISIPAPMSHAYISVGPIRYGSRPYPRRKMVRDYCSWTQASECPHVSTCDRTITSCREVYEYSVNFGGFAVVERGGVYA